ncbi:MAG TPA: Rieske 2Fe-2S domain-containing protein [Wenzhouxiangella sp.]|nr:Rieske 2Fe-2S domain-containing protein [Wenzhouxiangella sp.]
MSEPVFLCSAEDLAEGQYCELQVNHNNEPVWLIATRHNGQPRVWLNICPHQGRQLNFAPNRFLTDKENRLVCVHHGAVFEPAEGVCISGPCRNAELRSVEIHETDGRVMAVFNL